MRSSCTLRCAAFALATAGIAGPAVPAFASGFALREVTPDLTGNAFVGGAAKAYDAGTVYSNPAGMTRLDANQVEGAGSFIAPYSSFSGANYFGPGITTPGSQGGNVVEPAGIGSAFGVLGINPDLKIGLAVTVPFGQRISNPTDFVGRYQSLVSSITDVQTTLALAYRVNEHLSIGGGPVVDYFQARLTQALNLGPLNQFGNATGDVNGSDVGIGYNLGILYEFNADTRIGLDYHSRIQHGIAGNQTVSPPPLLGGYNPALAAAIAAQSSNAQTNITLPDSVSFGLYHKIAPRLALVGEVEWTHWSLIRDIIIIPGSGAPPTVLNENWRSTIFAGLGLNYQLLDNVVLKTGFSYDMSPVTDSNRTTRIPDTDHYILGIGVAYEVTPRVRLELAYAHIFCEPAPINNAANATSGQIIGTYSDHDDTVSAGITVKF
jgi:long-chain fatty acid transport protein